eukprot:4139428-Amphidinium_carterae.1
MVSFVEVMHSRLSMLSACWDSSGSGRGQRPHQSTPALALSMRHDKFARRDLHVSIWSHIPREKSDTS